jgi:DNA polymerase III sliding clamp (beta) subunit (PCNA family)
MNKHANLRLTAKLLPIIAPFMAKNDIRYYLNAINVRPHSDGGAVICATNGHALGAIHDRDAVCEHEVILRFDARMQQACASGLANERAVVMIGDRLAVVENGSAEVYIQAGRPDVEAQYPRYERVIPKEETLQPGLVGLYGGPLIALCEKAASAAAKTRAIKLRGYSGLQFFTVNGDSQSSAVVRMLAAPEFVGVLMPMRGDDPISATPAWVARLPVVDDLASMSAGGSA